MAKKEAEVKKEETIETKKATKFSILRDAIHEMRDLEKARAKEAEKKRLGKRMDRHAAKMEGITKKLADLEKEEGGEEEK